MVPLFRSRNVQKYLKSTSTHIAFFISAIMYGSYAAAHNAWASWPLIAVCLFIAVFMPGYSRLSNWVERKVAYWTVSVTGGRLGRFVAQYAFNLCALAAVHFGGSLLPGRIEQVGGVLGAALVTTLASQGAQYVGIVLYNRGVGDLNRNVLIGLSLNIVVTALATAGMPVVKEIFLFGGIGIGAAIFSLGMLSDLRALIYPKRGVAVFFGTFNPFHKTHLHLVKRALEERRVKKVIIHPTVVPRFHAQAIERGEIHIDRVEDGILVFEKTDKADANVEYFPTGNRFFAPETRRLLISLAIEEASLTEHVEVAYFPEIYSEQGFHGVMAEIKRQNPDQPIHGIHGNDIGGMAVRAILDECGWVYPLAVRRRDNISATAIRAGAVGMTSEIVTQLLAQLVAGKDRISVNGIRYRNDAGVIVAS